MEKRVLTNIKKSTHKLHSSEKKVANFIIENPDKTTGLSVTQLAKESKVSVATVIRTCQHLGYEGFYQMKLLLSRELGMKETSNIIANTNISDSNFLPSLYIYIDSLFSESNIEKIKESASLITKSNNVFIVATGNTIPLCLDLEYRLNRLSIKAYTSASEERVMNYINNSSDSDCLISITRSGLSTPVIKAFKIAKKNNLKTITLTSNLDLPDFNKSDILIDLCDKKNSYISEDTGLVSHVGEYAVIDFLIKNVASILKSENRYKDTDFNMELNTPKL